ncbi:hypothetical protein H5V45_05875 [Nocardioides sp. KIGAM211]|uniref:DUF3558 domain-containing protein n=1 Tax=Nocardioides luti TaxID=2761101 RepID=A0A7X0REJ0_9ACTN|nr:hypothetical protein [Nocardioides luti]MBB6626844.1 hypothetical protein [Nocardioides luti]
MSDVRRPALATALTALLLLGATACTDDAPKAPAAAPSDPATPLEDLDTGSLVIVRDAFCDRVSPAEVEAVLGAEVDTSTSYDNGQPAQLSDRVKDVAHEFGCTWTATDGTVGRAWVFAPPVTPARARLLVKAAPDEAGDGCTRAGDAADFGAPSVAVVCDGPKRHEASFHGLFGDAWLSCSLTLPADGAGAGSTDRQALLDRTGTWCVDVAQAAAAGSG